MRMKLVALEDVLELLREYSDLKESDEELPHTKPRHGPCCTCGKCGHFYDDCVCTHNEIIRKLKGITFNE